MKHLVRKAEGDLIEKYGEEDIVLAGFICLYASGNSISLVVPTLNLISSMPCATSKYVMLERQTWNT